MKSAAMRKVRALAPGEVCSVLLLDTREIWKRYTGRPVANGSLRAFISRRLEEDSYDIQVEELRDFAWRDATAESSLGGDYFAWSLVKIETIPQILAFAQLAADDYIGGVECQAEDSADSEAEYKAKEAAKAIAGVQPEIRFQTRPYLMADKREDGRWPLACYRLRVTPGEAGTTVAIEFASDDNASTWTTSDLGEHTDYEQTVEPGDAETVAAYYLLQLKAYTHTEIEQSEEWEAEEGITPETLAAQWEEDLRRSEREKVTA